MPPMMPPQMPPQGGPPQGGGGGGAIAQVLAQLMQSPAAMQGMQNFMQGQPPTAGMPMPQGPPQGGPPPGPPMEGEAPPDEAEAMAAQQIDTAGATWDGVDAPTQNDIQRLKEDPSQAQSFDEHFGDGMAEKYLGDDEAAEGDSEAPPAETSEPEYDE
jgi:hypothetical protein